jgi:site-specific DNA-methyltransferase (adenine-specific)
MFTGTQYNPDILSCLANLSSDEVFTPPKLANEMLDLLPSELWSNKHARFLDPMCKSGVFLREIAKRLLNGLEKKIPDLQDRIDHVFHNQIYGIAITELTGLLARRSVYCSKKADGEFSISQFNVEHGNIIFERVEHNWKGKKCEFCGAGKAEYDRNKDFETHAYHLIHIKEPENIFDMKFDVIIGNPPYQLSDGGFKSSASPIYHLFVNQAKEMSPRHLVMIVPSRWFAGGKGLNDFRAKMLSDTRIKEIVDYPDATEVFPGVDIAGGVCYFHWERDYSGVCKVTNRNNDREQVSDRYLNEFDVFIRYGRAVPIVKKVLKRNEQKMSSQVSSRKPFGLETTVRPQKSGDLVLRWQSGEGPFRREDIEVGKDLIDKWKAITSYVGYDHAGQPGVDGKRRVFSKIDILPPGTICTETYLVVGSFDEQQHAVNLVNYMKTRFFRFLVSQFMYSHHITKSAYEFVPILDMSRNWSDDELYARYDLSEDEIAFVDSMIKPMQIGLFDLENNV